MGKAALAPRPAPLGVALVTDDVLRVESGPDKAVRVHPGATENRLRMSARELADSSPPDAVHEAADGRLRPGARTLSVQRRRSVPPTPTKVTPNLPVEFTMWIVIPGDAPIGAPRNARPRRAASRRPDRPTWGRKITVRRPGQNTLSRKYTLLSGALLTAIAAAAVFACSPMNYRSTGTLVVMPAKQSARQSTNPLLALDGRTNTTASMLTQTINSPLMSFRAGLLPETDTVTAKNAAIGSATTGNGSPLISITAESPDAQRSPAIISWVTDLSRENLAQIQHELRVAKRNSLTLGSVIAPTPSAPVLVPPVAVTMATVLLGLLLTMMAAYGDDLSDNRRRRHELAPVLPFKGAGQPPTVVPAQPAASLGTREDRKAG